MVAPQRGQQNTSRKATDPMKEVMNEKGSLEGEKQPSNPTKRGRGKGDCMWNKVRQLFNEKIRGAEGDGENVGDESSSNLKMTYKTSVPEKWNYHMTELPLKDVAEKDNNQTVSACAEESFVGESASEKQLP